MFTRLLKSAVANLGLAVIITGSVGLLGWWWKVQFNEEMAPTIKTISVMAVQLTHVEAHQETLRTEVKEIAENKVDRVTFRDTIDEIDNRLNTIEIGDYLSHENKDITDPGGSNEH